MAKKKVKKGKGADKGKKKKKKEGLSHLQREIFLLTIEELQHKINWRNHLCDITEEDLQLYSEALELHKRDEKMAVECLEKAIGEEKLLAENIIKVIPEAENSKLQVEETCARDLASTLVQMNDEKLSCDQQLEVLKNKLQSLEMYNKNKMDERIAAIQEQLKMMDADDSSFKELEQKKRREEAFIKAMQSMLIQEAEMFQDETNGKMDKNFSRIAEETRWWADLVSDLRIETDRLKMRNKGKRNELKNLKKEIKAPLAINQRLQESKALLKELLRNEKYLTYQREENAELTEEISRLHETSTCLKESLEQQKSNFREILERMRRNENEITALEKELSSEISFGHQLSFFIERAEKIIASEVKRSLILTYDGPPKEKKTLADLRLLFDDATRYIYGKNNLN